MTRNIAPGYCVVERAGSLEHQARELFRDTRAPAVTMFMQLNADTPWLRPGQILIVADPETQAPLTLHALTALRQAKHRINNALIGVSVNEADFMQKNYATIAALTSAGNQIFGITGDAGAKYFSAIEQTLIKIEASYQNQFRAQGTLISQQFFVERNKLLNQLKELVNKPVLKNLSRYTIKFQQYENMKRALNLSSRSIVHEWSTVGLGGIPGYSTYVGNAAKAARFLKMGGYVGIAFSFAGATNDVMKACTVGREGECSRSAFSEYSKFGLSTAAGIGAGAAGSAIGLGFCTAIGIATAGVGGVACAAVGSVAAGYAAGEFMNWGVDAFYNHMGL